jgi:hypothetical protein
LSLRQRELREPVALWLRFGHRAAFQRIRGAARRIRTSVAGFAGKAFARAGQ